ncbi:hypothetical protein ACRAWD_10430 [Caulobacter segnis]
MFDRDFEGEQIGLARRGGVDHRVAGVAVRLLIVEREMLDRRDDVVSTRAPAICAPTSAPASKRILAAILKVPTIARLARRFTPPASMTR